MKRDWLQPGSEPSISELLDDPTTHTIMRHDGLKAEQIWKVVDKAKRKLVLRAAKRDRREREEAKQRSVQDDPRLPTAKDPSPIDSLGEWPDMLGVAALQRPEPDLRGPRPVHTFVQDSGHSGQLEPRRMTRPRPLAAFVSGRNKPPFRTHGYTAKASDRIAAYLSKSG